MSCSIQVNRRLGKQNKANYNNRDFTLKSPKNIHEIYTLMQLILHHSFLFKCCRRSAITGSEDVSPCICPDGLR